jgi:7-carboxy-7-deazaguanine synthase
MTAHTASVSEIFASAQGEGAHVGRRHLFVRFGGCNLRCRYCDTPESLLPTAACRIAWADGRLEARPNPLDVATLDDLVAQRAGAEPRLHALALTGGEPLLQAGFLARWLPARTVRLPVLLETAATLPRQLDRVLPWIDIVSADIKLPSNAGEPPRWADHEACLRLAAGRATYVKILIDDGTDPRELAHAVRLVAAIDEAIPVFLQPITDPVDGRLRIAPATLERFYRDVAALVGEVRVVPQTHKLLGLP